MFPRLQVLAVLLALVPRVALAQHQHGTPPPAEPGPPPLYENLGNWSHPVTTSVPMAQKFFDQGLRLYYGFNHDEAVRAFREALRLDPTCAMAWWGVAMAAGPNINLPMDADHAKIASEAIHQARTLWEKAGPLDRVYIEALATRYSDDPKSSRAQLDSAYADAMRLLSRSHPEDVDARVLFAESLMDLNPWNQWTHAGRPNPGTLEIVAILEGALKASPDHPGANHFYIHAVEASPNPERALEVAHRLKGLVPGAGHLVHMPSHIYARTGAYEDARNTNRDAVEVDEKYIAEQNPQGAYPLMYYNHNIQFIWFSAGMQGRSAEALEAARKIEGHLPPDMVRQMSMIEFVGLYPIVTLARFGRWDEVLAQPAPPKDLRFATAIWNYARGLAFAATGKSADARAALDTVLAIAKTTPADQMESINYAGPMLRVAFHALSGEIARRARRYDDAVRSFRRGVAAEDSMHYDEPPTWYYPVRQELGAALLAAGKAKQAEAAYREDLLRHPENGWSLFGLSQALRAQKRSQEASATEARFAKAWAQADVKLTASAF